jgi:hypothetical protein
MHALHRYRDGVGIRRDFRFTFTPQINGMHFDGADDLEYFDDVAQAAKLSEYCIGAGD